MTFLGWIVYSVDGHGVGAVVEPDAGGEHLIHSREETAYALADELAEKAEASGSPVRYGVAEVRG